MAKRDSDKAQELLKAHKAEIIEKLGASAFDLLTPSEVATELGVDTRRLPELIRLRWLEYAPGKDVGKAHQYYRWQVQFVKQFKPAHQPREKIPS